MKRHRARRERRHGPARRPKLATAPPPAVPYSRLLACLKRAPDRVTVPGLVRLMGLPVSDEPELRRQMEYLEKQQIVFSQRRGRWSLHARTRIVIGRLSCPEGTYGFVSAEETGKRDVFIAGRRMAGARHGDLVMARVIGRPVPGKRGDRSGGGGSEGEVLAVLERRPPFLAGQYRGGGNGGLVTPRDDRVSGTIVVDGASAGAEAAPADGSIVWVEITSPEDRFRPARGRIAATLGLPEEAGVDEATIVRIHDLPGAFPPEAEREALSHPPRIDERERARREDFTGSQVVTVDPATAKDHDDAVGLVWIPTARGEIYRLAVHIADVAHYVPEGGHVDREALRRGTSVYFPGRCIPMLPEALSSGLCSLHAGEERLVHSVLLDFDAQGRRLGYRFADGVIRSAAAMTYAELQEILDGGEDGNGSAHAPMLREMGRLCRLLRTLRLRRGSLDLEIPQTEVIVDDSGRPIDVQPVRHGLADQVIEEFMLAANETVAEHLREHVPASLYRIHEDPDPEGIDEVEERLATMGFPVRRTRGTPSARLSAILAPFKGRPQEPAVSMMVLRSLKLARYSHEPIAHFGLAAPLYTHFTSPIRRYPDLIVHRLLRGAPRAGPTRPDEPDPAERLAAVALQCSRLERRAEEAERAVVDWKKAVYMKDRVGEEFQGVVTGAARGALFVTLEGLGIDGVVPVGAGREASHGRGARGPARPAPWRPGDALRVRVQAVDTFRARILLKPLSTG
ncbi:MAG TPA: VacB/RNase II family 3'-5' exoribonuclease [Candidatus Polarisedimenticolia bacterium]|jgi:ribonuclease R